MSALVSLPERDIGAEVVSPLVQAEHVQLPANATALAFAADNRSLAVALGDGSVSLVTRSALGGWGQINRPCHRVAAVAVASLGSQFVTAGQDGAVRLVDPEGQVAPEPLYHAADHWIEALAVHEVSGTIAVAAGREVAILRADGQRIGTASLAETPTGLDFAPDGGRLVASHYNGLTVIDTASGAQVQFFEWKGSHIGVTWSPCGNYIVTATQERMLHGWNLRTGKHFRMGGYPRKTHQMAWTDDASIMACSGADVITAWSFAHGGPGGKPPLEIGFVFGGTVTTVAVHPSKPLVAGGFNTGNVLIGATRKGEAVVAQARTGVPVTAMAWSPYGDTVAAADSGGRLSLFALAADLKVH